MKIPSFDSLKVGEEIPALITPPVTRHTLALYCGASGDLDQHGGRGVPPDPVCAGRP